jgi:V/A-type H+-transporting ATPase subunit C
LQYLQDTFLRDYLTPGTAWADFSDICDRCFYDMALSLKGDAPSSLPVDLFLLQGDYLNLKAALTGSSDFPFHFGLLSQEKLVPIREGEQGDLPLSLRESETGIAGESGKMDAAILEILLDGAYLRHLLSIAQQLKSELVSMYVSDRVLSYIIIILWRALKQQQSLRRYQQYLLPLGDVTPVVMELSGMPSTENWPSVVGGEVGDILSEAVRLAEDEQIPGFELKVANHLTQIARDGKMQTAGPERVFAFLVGLQAELQNTKLVVMGRLNRIDPTLLRQRLREGYV